MKRLVTFRVKCVYNDEHEMKRGDAYAGIHRGGYHFNRRSSL